MDDFLRGRPEWVGRVREAHPELAFLALNGGRPMTHAKKTAEGWAERRAILRTHLPAADAVVDKAQSRFRRKVLARDDILDALVLAVAAREPLAAVPVEPETDASGLAMEIAYPDLFTHA